ncbi:Predicted Zn-dependent peptidase [Lutibacter agarilyticus]|uniref:Predicted Zn-dependent peptidase n=1 Tax=Lutibacter agarilyticus TaxID=1109740 RepID=A0A238VT66_9FLAO|nr:pitrilysin family protein [Lutibacter agarilyticus]SNR37344.1 Predicted Zn-dependent peptidase [Lutibacter agarilyticus]
MKTKFIYFITLLFLTVTASAQVDRSVQPKPGPSPKINLGKPQTFELKNGLKVLVVENHKLPRVSATLTIDNSPIFEGEKAGVSSLTGSLLGSGTKNIDKDAFNEEVDYLGAGIYFGSQSASLNSLSKYFPRVLELMADAAQNPVFSQEDFDKELNILKDGIKSVEKSVQNIAGRVQSLLAYGKNHPYGEYTSLKTLENVTLADVETFYNTYFKPNNAYLIIVGDVKFKEVKKLVTKQFSDWKSGEIPAYTIPAVENVAKTEIDFIDMPNAVQSDVTVLSTVDFKMTDDDYFAVLLANQIFGGDFNSYLNMNLREAHGYTYGARSGIRPNKHTASLFSAGAQVRNAVTDSTVMETMTELTKIRTVKVTPEELSIVKASYVGSFVRNIEKPETVARYALNIQTNNLPENFYENYLDKLNAVTIDDVERVSQKYFSLDNARIIVTGKALDVLPNLEKLPYTINYLDKEGNVTSKPELTKPIPEGVSKQTVIDAYFNAIGGADKIKALESTLVTYEASAMGSTILSTEKRTATKYANEMSMGGNVMARIIMTKDAVTMNKQPLPAAMASEMNYTLGTFSEIGLLTNENSKLTGIENIEGKDMYVISTKGEIVSTTIYFDVETGLKVKETQVTTMQGQTQNQESNFSDYKEFNGVKFPVTKSGNLGPQAVEFKLVEAKVNEGVSESDFE